MHYVSRQVRHGKVNAQQRATAGMRVDGENTAQVMDPLFHA